MIETHPHRCSMPDAPATQYRAIYAVSPKAAAALYLLAIRASADESHQVMIRDQDDQNHTFRMKARLEWVAQ